MPELEMISLSQEGITIASGVDEGAMRTLSDELFHLIMYLDSMRDPRSRDDIQKHFKDSGLGNRVNDPDQPIYDNIVNCLDRLIEEGRQSGYIK